jgi:hypothetical protein
MSGAPASPSKLDHDGSALRSRHRTGRGSIRTYSPKGEYLSGWDRPNPSVMNFHVRSLSGSFIRTLILAGNLSGQSTGQHRTSQGVTFNRTKYRTSVSGWDASQSGTMGRRLYNPLPRLLEAAAGHNCWAWRTPESVAPIGFRGGPAPFNRPFSTLPPIQEMIATPKLLLVTKGKSRNFLSFDQGTETEHSPTTGRAPLNLNPRHERDIQGVRHHEQHH